ncbi:DUF4097 domain-containing protein [Dawidia soli]|uniref:DUF4097 domain-containing protein n=1 Tax=Dawidia soli TaxID=2782352 RepID=A0AAP2DC63_9BACT|nr:DUF4097 domain-containing protein [Dawidia soli]MBT1687960.1 hypothetical protein [Dawidia soli]
MKKYIQTFALTLVYVTVSLLAHAQNEFTIPLSDPGKRGKLKVHINYGSITVKGTARKDVLVKYTSETDGEDEGDNRKNADGMRRVGGGGTSIEATETNNQVKVQSDSWSHKQNFSIEVPSGFDLDLHTYNDGDLIVNNIQGELELTNYNGPITALNVAGSAIATTYNGEIKVTFDKVNEGVPMSFTTYNGDIDISFPATIKGSMKVRTDQGEILTNFDITFKTSGPVQKKDSQSGVYKVIVDEWKRCDINGGGPEFTMRNYHGDIFIRKK